MIIVKKKLCKTLAKLLSAIATALLLIVVISIIRLASDENEHSVASLWSTVLLAWAQLGISVLNSLAEKLISDEIEDIRKKFRKSRKRSRRRRR